MSGLNLVSDTSRLSKGSISLTLVLADEGAFFMRTSRWLWISIKLPLESEEECPVSRALPALIQPRLTTW
jgi:hypothetical protein